MRKLKIIEHISLDGVIQVGPEPGETNFIPGDWTGPYRTPAGLALVLELYGETFDLLLGRKTYDQWSGFWPKAPASPMADRLRAATKFVVTHRPENLDWGPVQGLSKDLIADVRALKENGSKDLIVSGSTTLTSPLMEHGLADELILLVNPVLLGQGKRIFTEGTPPRAFTFQAAQATATGILVNRYLFEGPLRNLK